MEVFEENLLNAFVAVRKYIDAQNGIVSSVDYESIIKANPPSYQKFKCLSPIYFRGIRYTKEIEIDVNNLSETEENFLTSMILKKKIRRIRE